MMRRCSCKVMRCWDSRLQHNCQVVSSGAVVLRWGHCVWRLSNRQIKNGIELVVGYLYR